MRISAACSTGYPSSPKGRVSSLRFAACAISLMLGTRCSLGTVISISKNRFIS